MLQHYTHTHDRENINKELTHLNYNLEHDHGNKTDYQFVMERVEETKSKFTNNRSDINVMCDWVVTLPKDYAYSEREFFETAYDFLSNRYGMKENGIEKNIISCWVHKDEPNAQPHMHFAFVPVVHKLDKTQDEWVEKLSAKDCINRTELSKIHNEMERYMSKRLGHEIGLLNGATKERNKDIEIYKAERIKDDIAEVRALRALEKQTYTPKRNMLGGIDKKEYEKVIEFERAKQLRIEREKQDALRDTKEEVLKERENAIRWEQSARGEHERRLELQDMLNDKDYLKQRVRDLEREERPQDKEKDIAIRR
jgi:hypothetical protein